MKTNAPKKDDERARDQAKCQFESIQEMVSRLESKDEDEQEKAREEIQEDPLEVSIRSGWYSPGSEHEAEEYLILLCTGGPAVRIIGELGAHNEPETARLQYQDWFTPWEEYVLEHEEYETLLTYARQFYFGD